MRRAPGDENSAGGRAAGIAGGEHGGRARRGPGRQPAAGDGGAGGGNVEFIDLVPAFLGADGQPRRELFVEDGTHFSAAGYAVVAGLLRGKL